MSYKLKSLCYFAAFVASVFIYDAMNSSDNKDTVSTPEKLAEMADHAQMSDDGHDILMN